MTTEELARFDGRNGHSSYVAISGTIYDVSSSEHWQDGQHREAHQAGCDLTEALRSAPHVRSVVERFPVVGKLENPGINRQRPVTGIPLLSIIIIAFVVLLMIATYMV